MLQKGQLYFFHYCILWCTLPFRTTSRYNCPAFVLLLSITFSTQRFTFRLFFFEVQFCSGSLSIAYVTSDQFLGVCLASLLCITHTLILLLGLLNRKRSLCLALFPFCRNMLKPLRTAAAGDTQSAIDGIPGCILTSTTRDFIEPTSCPGKFYRSRDS